MSLLGSLQLKKAENRLISILDSTIERALNVRSLDYSRELPRNITGEFGSRTYAVQLDIILTEIIRQSLLYADGQMKSLSAAALNESYILTEETVRMSTELAQNVTESIIRTLRDDKIYYQHPNTLARDIKDLWNGERYRAVRFARTFTADVATHTTVYRYRQHGVGYMEFDAELDGRTTDQCRALHGTIFDLSKGDVDLYRPPLHFHCRSGLKPIPITREIDQDQLFENRDFSGHGKAFADIDVFNRKYRISKFVLDQDLEKRIALEKGLHLPVKVRLVDIQKPAPQVFDPQTLVYLPQKTIKTAEKWLLENTPIKHVDYKGLDVRVANAMNEAYVRHVKLEPLLVDKIKYYGTAQGHFTFAYEVEIKMRTEIFMTSRGLSRADAESLAKRLTHKQRADPNTRAHYWPRGDDANGLAVNKMYGKDFDEFTRSKIESENVGWNPIGTGSVKGTLDHEFGHAIDDIYKFSDSSQVSSYLRSTSYDVVKKGLSQYAVMNPKEFIAEAWTEYINNPSPRPIAKMIGDMMMESISQKH
ncbi:MAG: minor capsid protein [Methanolobus sp.]|uniref:minor capsid protein n=1 Tax=Methanolobus sp. TaxID=1874737 RepID=UPI00272F7360|nr:minor capsid protein [Methanolobus sp.]MDP2217387.1 minor capsid protein [Methanolobus sp.]